MDVPTNRILAHGRGPVLLLLCLASTPGLAGTEPASDEDRLRCHGIMLAEQQASKALSNSELTLADGSVMKIGEIRSRELPPLTPEERPIVEAVAEEFREGAMAYQREWMVPIMTDTPQPDTMSPPAKAFVAAFMGCLDRMVGN